MFSENNMNMGLFGQSDTRLFIWKTLIRIKDTMLKLPEILLIFLNTDLYRTIIRIHFWPWNHMIAKNRNILVSIDHSIYYTYSYKKCVVEEGDRFSIAR